VRDEHNEWTSVLNWFKQAFNVQGTPTIYEILFCVGLWHSLADIPDNTPISKEFKMKMINKGLEVLMEEDCLPQKSGNSNPVFSDEEIKSGIINYFRKFLIS